MAFEKKEWKNKGEEGYLESKINSTNLNDLEERIFTALLKCVEIDKNGNITLKVNKKFQFETGEAIRANAQCIIIAGTGGSVYLRPISDSDNRCALELKSTGDVLIDGRYIGQYRGSVTDFNQCLAHGEYYVGEPSILNAPYSGDIYGKLNVRVSNNKIHENKTTWIWQDFIDTRGRIFRRFKTNNNNWTPWKREISLLDEIYPIGSVYQSINNNGPTTDIGINVGQWEYLGTYTIGSQLIHSWKRTG